MNLIRIRWGTVACCWPSNFKTQVHGAKNLRPADVNGLADPFCASWPVGRERSIHRNLRVRPAQRNQGLIKGFFQRIIANKPLIRPYFMRGGIGGGSLRFQSWEVAKDLIIWGWLPWKLESVKVFWRSLSGLVLFFVEACELNDLRRTLASHGAW